MELAGICWSDGAMGGPGEGAQATFTWVITKGEGPVKMLEDDDR